MENIEIIKAPTRLNVAIVSKIEMSPSNSSKYDTVFYEVLEDTSVTFLLDGVEQTLTINSGFIHDQDSVPRIPLVYAAYKGVGAGVPCAFHDYLYRYTDLYPKKVADTLFYKLMVHLGVDEKRAKVVYQGVNIGGHLKWKGEK
jgi:hypothetical protein